jgi:hypothetical protein
MKRHLVLAAVLAVASTASLAVGQLANVTVTDRTTGEELPVYLSGGRQWIEGKPGHRYAINVRNQGGGRVLAVVAVDGINAVTGETAAWQQTGYVFAPWQGWEVTGWRKSDRRVAAFEFTALPESYAARTGRPDDVGVIGVALFRERVPVAVAPAPEPPWATGGLRDRAEPAEKRRAESSSDAPRSRAAEDAAAASQGATAPAPLPERLGTGHGPSETSVVGRTSFERARATPDEVVMIHYDRRERLVAMGVLPPTPVASHPRPFPGSMAGYVPDPPRY